MSKKQLSYEEMAKRVASRGRHGDNVLVHFGRAELQGLGNILGVPLSKNPDTGLPEAFAWFIPLILAAVGGLAGAASAPKGQKLQGGLGGAVLGGLGGMAFGAGGGAAAAAAGAGGGAPAATAGLASAGAAGAAGLAGLPTAAGGITAGGGITGMGALGSGVLSGGPSAGALSAAQGVQGIATPMISSGMAPAAALPPMAPPPIPDLSSLPPTAAQLSEVRTFAEPPPTPPPAPEPGLMKQAGGWVRKNPLTAGFLGLGALSMIPPSGEEEESRTSYEGSGFDAEAMDPRTPTPEEMSRYGTDPEFRFAPGGRNYYRRG